MELASFSRLAVLALAVPAGGLAQRAANAPPTVVDLSKTRMVDLTHPFDEHTLYWPTAPSGFKLTRLHYGPTEGGFFYSANSFCAPEHGGTHLDAPVHFAPGGWTTDEVPVEKLVRPAVVIDVTAAAAAAPD